MNFLNCRLKYGLVFVSLVHTTYNIVCLFVCLFSLSIFLSLHTTFVCLSLSLSLLHVFVSFSLIRDLVTTSTELDLTDL
jgi:hypothetical protein